MEEEVKGKDENWNGNGRGMRKERKKRNGGKLRENGRADGSTRDTTNGDDSPTIE